MKETYTYHTDNGHGWLEVPLNDFHNAGLWLHQVSRYSFAEVKGDKYVPTLYLEHHCHMAFFLDAITAKNIAFDIVEKHHSGDAYIRKLGRIS